MGEQINDEVSRLIEPNKSVWMNECHEVGQLNKTKQKAKQQQQQLVSVLMSE